MAKSNINAKLVEDIQHNCNISDARDHGIYSMCTMVLKLRNLYKWEHHLEPWQEAEPADLLDWIDEKEHYWKTIASHSYRSLVVNGRKYSPDKLADINRAIAGCDLVYGAGYGRSMKAVFFLAEKLEEYTIADCPIVVLGRERAKEMASPFAMAQDSVVYIRKDPLRYFLWDQIQELRSSCRLPLHHALHLYGLLKGQELDQEKFKENLDSVMEQEIPLFVYHEVGELLQTTLDSVTLEKIILTFPGSIIELVCRTIKDLLADTHPSGPLAFIVAERRETTLSFYVGFLDGLRKKLFPEINEAWQWLQGDGDWLHVENARRACRANVVRLAETIRELADAIGESPVDQVEQQFNARVIAPLGLDISTGKNK